MACRPNSNRCRASARAVVARAFGTAVLSTVFATAFVPAPSAADSTGNGAWDSTPAVTRARDTTSALPTPAVAVLLDSVGADTLRMLPAIVVRARRPSRQEALDRLPSGATAIELGPVRDRLTTTADVLAEVPGLRVHDYGSLGTFSTVSIRGSGSRQVSVYLDGIPLARAGLGVVNLADLPFAGVERIEVYRGQAPSEFVGASLGGAINLVSRAASIDGPPRHLQSFVAGLGSFGTRRLGLSQELARGGFGALLVADVMDSDGDFVFHHDFGTNLETGDDRTDPRRNNGLRHDEILFRLAHALPRHGQVRIANQWVRRRHGVPGLPSTQSEHASAGATWNVTSADLRAPRLLNERVELVARADYEWRRDTFTDRKLPSGEIGLGLQNNSDVTTAWGGHAGTRIVLPAAASLGLDVDARRERFQPWRQFPPSAGYGPVQRRTTLAGGCDARWLLLDRLALHGGLRLVREDDDFSGDLRNVYSLRPARAEERTFTEPAAGARLRLWRGLHARTSWARHHRTPGFLDLFGDGGSVAGNSELRPEDGTNFDWGVQAAGTRAGIDARFEATWFRNRVEHLITFVPQSQNIFKASNIGAARLDGDEWVWRLADAGPAARWIVEGNCTRLDALDLGKDTTWYTGKTLPGRPALQLYQRVAVRVARFEVSWDLEHLSRNYLDRANSKVVAQRDLHGLDVAWGWRGAGVRLGLRNLTDDRASDVAGFPLPGRTVFMTTSYTH